MFCDGCIRSPCLLSELWQREKAVLQTPVIPTLRKFWELPWELRSLGPALFPLHVQVADIKGNIRYMGAWTPAEFNS